jgi:hypothetical protein
MRNQPDRTSTKKPPTPSVKVRPGHLSPKARRALELLAIDQRGLTETLLSTYGFTRGMLAGLVRSALATAQRQTVKAGGKTIEVVRIRITDDGRRAIEGVRPNRKEP